MNSQKQQDLKAQLERGIQFQKSKQHELAKLPQTVSAGELYLFPVSIPVTWCAIFQNSKDSDLWFVVPGDDFSLLGTSDVALPESSDEYPMNFRCGHGLWVHREEFDFSRRIGRIDLSFVDQIRDHLGRIVRSDLPKAESILETDSDPDYQNWIAELSAEVQAFEQRLLNEADEISTEEPVCISISVFREHRIEDLGGLVSQQDLSMAAESKSSYSVDPSDSRPKSCELPFDTQGKIFALKYQSGIVIQAFGFEEEPPNIMLESSLIEWHRESDWFTSSLFGFSDGKITIALGSKKVVIEE